MLQQSLAFVRRFISYKRLQPFASEHAACWDAAGLMEMHALS